MGHNSDGINLYGVIMTLMGNLHAGGQSSLGHLNLLHRYPGGGGGTVGIIGWGGGGGRFHWTSKCMGHIESKIKNLKGILRVFSPFFDWRVCHIKVQKHTLYTNYLLSYCRKYTEVFLI